MFQKIKDFLGFTSVDKTYNSIMEEADKIVEDKVYTFNVAGISYHYDELEKIIRSLLKECVIEKFDGYTNRDLIEMQENMMIYEHQYIKGCKLEPYTYNNKDAIRILLPDYKGKWYDVGNVPKKELNKVIDILNNYTITNIEFCIVGGKIKYVNDDNTITEDELNYGVEIYIKYH